MQDQRTPLRRLTILFSDLSSSVGLAAQMDCFDYVRFLQDVRAMFRACSERHGGAIARLQGDGVLAIFGHDRASDDDGYRAICCALDLHEATRGFTWCAESKTTAALHSGIYAGSTYLEGGDLERGRYDLIGNAPNLAARLSGLAERDSILAAEDVISPYLGNFRVAERRELLVKGWVKPIPSYVVVGRAAPEDIARKDDSLPHSSLPWGFFGPDQYAFPGG